jgi:hypothetical protein
MAKKGQRDYYRPVGADPIDRFGGPNTVCNMPILMVMESNESDKLTTGLSALRAEFCATGWNTGGISGRTPGMK